MSSNTFDDAYEHWQSAEAKAVYYKALTGAVNRLRLAMDDVEKFGYALTLSVTDLSPQEDPTYRDMYEQTKSMTVEELSTEGWGLIISPPSNYYTGGTT